MLSNYLETQLEKHGVSLDEFRELTIRLLNYGILCRDESQIEQQLYDRYLRIDELVKDYLHLVDITLYHDRRFAYIRVYPPGSEVPGMHDGGDSPYSGSLRSRLGQQEVATLLILRLQYDKALREGKIDDEGYAAESLEAVSIALRNHLGRTLPSKTTERKRLFQRLRQLRVIEFQRDDDFDDNEAWLRIHPMIVDFVNDDALDAMEQDQNTPVTPEQAVEGDDYVS